MASLLCGERMYLRISIGTVGHGRGNNVVSWIPGRFWGKIRKQEVLPVENRKFPEIFSR